MVVHGLLVVSLLLSKPFLLSHRRRVTHRLLLQTPVLVDIQRPNERLLRLSQALPGDILPSNCEPLVPSIAISKVHSG